MMKQPLQLKLGQSLTMTPQLQQAIRLLQLPVLDLNAQILEAIEENIMLEVEELPDIAATETDTNRDDDTNGEVEIEEIGAEDDWQSVSMERDWSSSGSSVAEFADLSGNSLREHLLW